MKTMLLVLLTVIAPLAATRAATSDPETVLVTFHVRPGKTDELLRLVDRTWSTYQRLSLVFEKPHLVMHGQEKEGDFVVEILTWKSHSAPDNAPAEVHALWDQMQSLCEKRGGRDSIEIPEVTVVRNNS